MLFRGHGGGGQILERMKATMCGTACLLACVIRSEVTTTRSAGNGSVPTMGDQTLT